MTIGQKVEEVVKNSGYTVTAFAEGCGIHVTTLYNIIKREHCDTAHLVKILAMVDMKMSDFFKSLEESGDFLVVNEKDGEYIRKKPANSTDDLITAKDKIISILEDQNSKLHNIINKLVEK